MNKGVRDLRGSIVARTSCTEHTDVKVESETGRLTDGTSQQIICRRTYIKHAQSVPEVLLYQ